MARIADTSVLYALFDSDEDRHEQARADVSDPTPIQVPSEILVETVNLIEDRSSWSTANEALGRLLERPHVGIADPVPMDGVIEAFDRGGGALSLADAVVVQTCRVHGRRPLAFDAGIQERAGDSSEADDR